MNKLFFLAVLLASSVDTLAFRIEYGGNIVISTPVYEDLYIAGGSVTINAPVYGDLIIAGGNVIINDSVANDIIVAGGTVSFNGFAGDDIRCAGGRIYIAGNVSGDVVVTSGRTTIENGVTIGGLMAGGGNIAVNGAINGNVRAVFGYLALNGPVTGNIDCRGSDLTINGIVNGQAVIAAKKISIGSSAAFNGSVRYWNKKGSVDFKQSLKNGNAVFDPSLEIPSAKWYYLGSVTPGGLLWYLGTALLMILVIQFLFSATMKKAASTFYDKTVKSIGFGFMFLLAVPALAVVALVTLIGVPIGLLLIIAYVALLLLATVIIAIVLANWINNMANKDWNLWKLVFTAFGIFILLKLAFLTPVIGWIAMILFACAAFGSIVLNVNWKTRKPVTQAQ